MTEVPAEKAPMRYAHCCDTYDDAPRVQEWVEDPDQGGVKLYHRDGECVPEHLKTDVDVQAGIALRESGLKDDALRAALVEFADAHAGLDPAVEPQTDVAHEAIAAVNEITEA